MDWNFIVSFIGLVFSIIAPFVIIGVFCFLMIEMSVRMTNYEMDKHQQDFKIDPEKAARSRDYYFDFEKGEVVYIDYIPYKQ